VFSVSEAELGDSEGKRRRDAQIIRQRKLRGLWCDLGTRGTGVVELVIWWTRFSVCCPCLKRAGANVGWVCKRLTVAKEGAVG
jgi:hypothetical protein